MLKKYVIEREVPDIGIIGVSVKITFDAWPLDLVSGETAVVQSALRSSSNCLCIFYAPKTNPVSKRCLIS